MNSAPEAVPPDAFARRFGFPRSAVTLANWRKAPYSRWGFGNVRELAPTAPMHPRRAAPPPVPETDALWRERIDGVPLDAFLRESATDLLYALKDGRPAALWRASHADADRPHLLFSVSKSLTALVAGQLAEAGLIDLEAPIIEYLPEAQGSAYADTSVRHLLDMRVSLGIDEQYAGADGWGRRYCRAVLWDPQDGHAAETHLALLLSTPKGAEEHGGPFRYRSGNSDLLGVVLSRAGGEPFAALARRHLWEPLGATGEAHVCVDREGTAQTAGGMSVTAHDLALAGEAMRGSGALPERFLRDTLENGDAQAWAAGDFAALFPGARYRNKWYVLPDGSFFASGIHGQWLFVDPVRAVTLVKLSAQPDAKSDETDRLTLRTFRGLAAIL